MATTEERTESPVHVLSREEAWAFFDAQARELLGMSGDEFSRRWEAGEWAEVADEPEYWDFQYMAMMIPSVR